MSRWPERKNYLKTLLGFFRNVDWEGIKVRFIISTGRTGIQFLAEFLNDLSNKIDARHEPDPDFLKLGIKYARGNITFKKARKKIKRGRLWVCDEINKKNSRFYIESNNRYFSLVPILWDIFPEARIIHIIRDGRDYVRSIMNRDHYTEKDGIYCRKNLRLQATNFPDDSYYNKWGEMSRFEKCCWQWVKRDNFILEEVKEDDRANTVKFEDIFNKNRKYIGLWNIIDFMELGVDKKQFTKKCNEFMNRKVNKSKRYEFPHWKNWNYELREKFMNMAGEHMRRYDYNMKDFI